MTKLQLLGDIKRERAALESTLAEISDEQLARTPDGGGWAVKDHLAHLTAWERMFVAHLAGQSDHAVVGMTPDAYANASLEELNTRIYEQHRNDAASDVCTAFRDSHTKLLERLESLTDADLEQPFWADDPARTVLDKAAGDTYGHYREHREWIEALVAALPAAAGDRSNS